MRSNYLAIYTVIFLSPATLILQGCTASNTSGLYSSGQAQREQSVRMGIVESVREVMIDKGSSGIGALAGAAIGGIGVGKNIGGGSGSIISGILGAVAGGAGGKFLEDKLSKEKALEITVKLDSGELRAITQGIDEVFKPGDRVRLLSADGVTRVTH